MPNDYLSGMQRGVADLAGLPVDTLLNLADMAIAAGGFLGKEAGLISTPPELINRAKYAGSGEGISAYFGIAGPTKGNELAYNTGRLGVAGGLGAAVGGPTSALKGLIGGNLSGLTLTEAQKRYPDNAGIQVLASMLPQVSSFVASNAIKAGTVPGYVSRISPNKTATANLGEDYSANLAILKKQGITSATRGMASGDPAALAAEMQMYNNAGAKNIPQAAMLKLAEQSKNSVTKIIDKLSGIADTDKAGTAFSNAYQANIDNLVSTRSKQAAQDFGAIKDKTTPVVTRTNIDTALSDLITEFNQGALPATGVVSKNLEGGVLKELRGIQDSLGSGDLSIGQAKSLLERYSGASVGKDRIFSDLDWRPQERRVSGILADALGKDLDVTANSGISDAAALRTARENYAYNSRAINDFSETTIGKFFNTDKEISGTDAYKKFIALPKEQKVDVLSTLPKDVVEGLQKTAQTELVKKAEAPFSIQKGKPTWDTETWLKGLDAMQRSGDYNILFSPEQRVALKGNIDALRMTMREGSMAHEPGGVSGAMMDIGRATAGARGGYLLKGAADLGNYLQGLNTEARANILFSPLNESQIAKGFTPPSKAKIVAGVSRANAALNPMQPQDNVDNMSDEEVISAATTAGFGQQQKSVDEMSDEEVMAAYSKEKQIQDIPINASTIPNMKNTLGNTGDNGISLGINPQEDITQLEAEISNTKPGVGRDTLIEEHNKLRMKAQQ